MHTRRVQRHKRIGSILVIAGALACLTPLFFWAIDAWRSQAGPEESPVMILSPAGVREEPAPPSPTVAESESEPVPQEQPPVVIHQPQPGLTYRLQIPSLNVNVPIQWGIDDSDLNKGAGHYPQTPLPGEPGNAALAGHRTIKGKPSYFYSLDKLRAGDLIYVTYPDRQVEFAVERVFVTDPYDLSVLHASSSSMLTLTTCDPPGTDENRLIVQARLVQVTGRN